MFGNLDLDLSGKQNITVERFDGIVTVASFDALTKAKEIDSKEAFDTFLMSYRYICGQDPPFYSEIAYVKRLKAVEEAKTQRQLQKEETQKENQDALAKQKARDSLAKSGLNLDALDRVISRLGLLAREQKELEKAGQTVKAKRKRGEVEQAYGEIENIFHIGRSISATSECPFERIMKTSLDGKSEGYEDREFKLSCYNRKAKFGPVGTSEDNLPQLIIVFKFVAPVDPVFSDISSGWPAWAKTSNDMTEKFEATKSRFTGSVEVVGGWEEIVFGSLRNNEKAVDTDSGDPQLLKLKVKVKISRLHPLS